MRLQVAHHIGQAVLGCAQDGMRMVGHDHPGMHVQALVRLAIAKAFQYDIAVNAPREEIDPLHHREREEVDGLLIADAVARGHASKVATGYRQLGLWSVATGYAQMWDPLPCYSNTMLPE